MMEHKAVSARTATMVWAVASGATILALTATLEHLPGGAFLSRFLPVAVVMAVASCKAWLILRFYLGLRNAQGSWTGLFAAFLSVIVAGVLAAQAAIIMISR
ncbi:cytochrome C oxidase subunit IV family protein [Thalassospira sp. MCCC 1A01428]|uniref:cytochrome C oxidase subunit IV family protein n=1 Tax=unclassified Thalassospira TaxID=2648997 RepID=UPI00111C31C7|nr:cytochrome C oxidase subunit IV family protein [Thalassospira sp. MCCC 1A01428]